MINDIVTLVTHVGEIVGRVKTEDEFKIEMESPRLFIPGGEGSGTGFANGICMTGEPSPARANFYKGSIVSVTNTHPELARAWQEATSGIII